MNPEKQEAYSYYNYKTKPETKFRKNFNNMKVHIKAENRNVVYRYLKTQKLLMQLFQKFGASSKKVNYEEKKKIYQDLSEGRRPISKNKTEVIQYKKHQLNEQRNNQFQKNRTHQHFRHATEPSPQIPGKNKFIQESYRTQSQIQRSNREEVSKMKKKMTIFNTTLKDFHNKVQKKQKGIKILKRYNTITNDYIADIPQDMAEETRQTIQQNKLLIKLCQEQYTFIDKNHDFLEKAEKMMRYKQPLISDVVRGQFYREIRSHKKSSKKKGNKIKQQLLKQKGLLNVFDIAPK